MERTTQQMEQNQFQKSFQTILDKRKKDRIEFNKKYPNSGACECGGLIKDTTKQKLCDSCFRIKKEKEDQENNRIQKIKDRQDMPEQYLEKIGVGKRYLMATFKDFKDGSKYVSFCQEWLKSPQALFLYGDCGSGKTHLASALCRELVRLEEMPRIKFVNASLLFLAIRATFNKDAEETEQSIVSRYCGYDYLFIDDLGAEKTSDWSRATMYLIIDFRDSHMLPTIITSNLNPNQLSENIDGRIASRLANGKIVKIDMPDYRLKR